MKFAVTTNQQLQQDFHNSHFVDERERCKLKLCYLTFIFSMELIMKLHKYSLAQLKSAIKSSASMRQVLMKVNVAPYGGNYDVLRKAINHFNLDVSHFTGQAWNKGKTLSAKVSIEQYLSNEKPIQSFKLKKRLLKEKIFEAKCFNCDASHWLGEPIPLELDHINGNNKDNRLENLRLLCPNCHALTPTYRSKNRIKSI